MPKNITIQKIIGVLLHRLKFILLATMLMGILFFLYSKFIITPMYSTSAMIYVQNYNGDSVSNKENNKIYSSDISGSSNLAKICVTLFQNSDEITSLYDGCYVNITVNESTFFITISVSGDDPQKCANVANQVADKCKTVFDKYLKYGTIGNIREAKVPTNPYEPSNLKNALLGLIVGLAASCLIAILLELIDTTIKADDDIQEIYGLPVFAEIPDFETQGR
ncbi:MAG: YveK family protein [Ruminococcus sp.]